MVCPPYAQNVETNVGKKFFQALDSSFPPEHPLHKLINRNTSKLSYRTMPNISRHNSKILNKDQPANITTGCNCQKSRVCPMPGQCMAEGVIYGATVKETISGKTETYTGLSEPPLRNVMEATYPHSSMKIQTTPALATTPGILRGRELSILFLGK